MRIAVPVLSGLATGPTAVVTGAYIRSCTEQPVAMHSLWCGTPPAGATQLASQDHCAGCLLITAGLLVSAGAAAYELLAARKPAPRKVRA